MIDSKEIPIPDIDTDDSELIQLDDFLLSSSPGFNYLECSYLINFFGFVLAELISSSKNSAICLAQSLADNNVYVLKVSARKAQLFKEFNNQKLLPNSNYLIKFYDIFELDSAAIIQMEYCPNKNVSKTVFSEEELWKMIHDIGNALYTIHSEGFIHLDVSPFNILSNDNVFKLSDYGTMCEDDDFKLDFEGSGPYASPEVLAFPGNTSTGPIEVSYQTDIFSFGIVLLELASRYRAPRGGSDDYNLLRKGGLLLGTEQFPCTFSKEFISLVNSMINPDPNKRPTSYQLITHPNAYCYNQN